MELNYCMSLSHCLSLVLQSVNQIKSEKNKVCEVSHRQDNEQEGERGERGGKGGVVSHSLTHSGWMHGNKLNRIIVCPSVVLTTTTCYYIPLLLPYEETVQTYHCRQSYHGRTPGSIFLIQQLVMSRGYMHALFPTGLRTNKLHTCTYTCTYYCTLPYSPACP